MKIIALATASAALLAASAASAADLGRKAPAAVDYVKVCDAYGTGFFYIPGSETCLQIGGLVRAEYRFHEFDSNYHSPTTSREFNQLRSDARFRLNFDARSATEFGLLRSFASVEFTVATSSASAETTLRRAFIQWGGLTAGRAQSFFDFYTGDHWSSQFETAHSDSIVNLFAYTFSFGNDVTATLSLEDSRTGAAARRLTDSSISSSTYGGNRMYDVVGNVNVAQTWGSAQIMAVAHQNYAETAAGGSKWGYAVGGGVTIKLPMIAEGDAFSIQAAYGKGAASYVSPDWYSAADFSGTPLVQSTAWSVAAGFIHYWTAKVSSSAVVSYASFEDGTSATTADLKQFDIGANLVWAPVNGLTIGAEVEYKDVNFKDSAKTDVNAIIGILRIERSF